MIQQVVAAANAQFGKLPPSAQKPVILTDGEIRRYVRRLLEFNFPDVSTLSYDQLSPQLTAFPLGVLTLVRKERVGAEQRQTLGAGT